MFEFRKEDFYDDCAEEGEEDEEYESDEKSESNYKRPRGQWLNDSIENILRKLPSNRNDQRHNQSPLSSIEYQNSSNTNNSSSFQRNKRRRSPSPSQSSSNPNNLHATHQNKRRKRSPSPLPCIDDTLNVSIKSILPSIKDTNLWLLPCQCGKERFCVEKILENKDKYQCNQRKQLFIHDAFSTDINNGYIYVEADKKFHVERASQNISYLKPYKIRMVPLNERSDVLRLKNSKPTIKRGQFVRFKRGIYDGDLAQIYGILNYGAKVILRVIPRIDYNSFGTMSEKKQCLLKKIKPKQELFDRNKIERYDDKPCEYIFDGILQTNIIKWRRKKYKNGFELITVAINKVDFDITADSKELEVFRTANVDISDDEDDDLKNVSSPKHPVKCPFIIGERVKVIDGAMINLKGTITGIKDNDIKIIPDDIGLNEMEFSSDELIKLFDIGCYVKVINGRYKDEIGTVIKIDTDNKTALIFIKLQSKEIYVNINDIIEIRQSLMMTYNDRMEDIGLYDIVHFGINKVGVVINIDDDGYNILDIKEEIHFCGLKDILYKSQNNRNNIAFDRYNNKICIGDIVVPHFGNFIYRNVKVKQINGSMLFCYSKLCNINGGIFVIKAKHCRIAGARKNKNDSRLRVSNNRKRSKWNKNVWIGKQVKIIKGSYKGMIGSVGGRINNKLEVKLDTKNKTIKIDCWMVKIIDGTERKRVTDDCRVRENDQMRDGGYTPAYNVCATPMHGNNNTSVWNPYY